MNRIMRKAREFFICGTYAAAYLCVLMCAPLLRLLPKYRALWLICERKTDARDNGYHFFAYLRKNHPEINAAYIIAGASPDYEKVSKIGRTVKPGSLCHMLSFACARVCISTHVMGYAPDTYRFAVMDTKLRLVRTKKVFLQHGVIETDPTELHYPRTRLDLFVCTAQPEYEFVKDNFGYPRGVVRRIGLCRYDRLLTPHAVKKQILVMPTWRIYLRNLTDGEFMRSEYYRAYSELINSEKMSRLLEENGYELVFYPHYELQRFLHLFRSDNPRIRTAAFGQYDVQELLMESAFLITDYSSVLFDFAYMQKPAAYYCFDEADFFAAQYRRGYFDYRRDGFGAVFDDGERLIEFVDKCVRGGAQMLTEYRERARRFFALGGRREKPNCEKTYEAIKELIEER